MDRIRECIALETIAILSGHVEEASLQKLKFLQVVSGLVASGKTINKRSVYYEAVSLFKSQARVNRLIKHYTVKFRCKQEELNIKSGLKGIFHGMLVFHYKGFVRSVGGTSLIPDMDEVEWIECECRTVLVIEKEAVFDRAVGKGHITVCGKGYPCLNTIKLLKMLEAQCRMVCLTDFDPYGLHIFLIYRKALSEITRIGLCCADLFEHKVRESGCVVLSRHDVRMIKMLKETILREDALFIEGLGYKMELEIVFNQEMFEIDKYLEGKII